ncbi:MAG: hypothetical protein LKE40_14315 [Spirochaetia bacterium]|jgi:xylulokinase|nr:hypothetical protein [Spirochaetia bacterium]
MILTVDIGTTTLKTALADTHGVLSHLSIQRLENHIEGPVAECNPYQYLQGLQEAVKTLPKQQVEAIIISGNAPTVVPVCGMPTVGNGLLTLKAAPARLWLDQRGKEFSPRVSQAVGSHIDGSFYLPKILRIKEKEPELFEQVTCFLTNSEYLVYALTGTAATVFPAKHLGQYYWTDSLLDTFGLDRNLFPPFVSPGTILGTLTKKAADALGLSQKTKVIAGGPDFYLSILGSGACSPHLACDRSGTSEGINLCISKQVTSTPLMCYEHPADSNLWNLSGVISTTGAAIDWGMRLLGLAKDDYRTFINMAKTAGKTDVLFHPYLNGERAPIWNSELTGNLSGLRLTTGRGEIALAIMEGICLAIYDVMDTMGKLGEAATCLYITDNHSDMGFLSQLKSTVLQLETRDLTDKPVELMGLSMLASTSLGYYGNLKEADAHLSRPTVAYHPDRKAGTYYHEKYLRFKELYRQTHQNNT